MLYFLLNWLVYSPHAFIFQFIGIFWGIEKSFLNLAMIFQLFNFFGAMYWGSLADRTKKYKLISAGCVIANTLFVCLMAFPMFSGYWRLAYYCFLTAGQCFFSAGTFPIIDAIVLSILEADPTAGKDAYGTQKVYGTIAHNVNAWVILSAYDHVGEDFFVMYYSVIVSMLALVGTILFSVPDSLKIKTHKHHGPAKKVEAAEEEPVPEGSSTLGLLKRPVFFVFLLSILASGIVRSVNTNNHSIYITDYLKLDKSAVGDLMLYRLPVEISLLFFAKTLISYTGPYWFLVLGQLSGVVRILAYLLLKPYVANTGFYYWILVFIEMLKGANSSLVSAGAFRIASDLAPAAWSGAAQTLVAGVWQGISMAVAAVFAYAVLKLFNEEDVSLFWTFAYTGILGCVSLLFVVFHYREKLFAAKSK